jgi:hypothetical protein
LCKTKGGKIADRQKNNKCWKIEQGHYFAQSWLDFLKEENQGQPIEAVAIEVTNVLRVSPIFKKVAEVPNE